jgi:hypothetical protein
MSAMFVPFPDGGLWLADEANPPRAPAWRGGMRLEQVEILERTFAVPVKSDGQLRWLTPRWVTSLRTKIALHNQWTGR